MDAYLLVVYILPSVEIFVFLLQSRWLHLFQLVEKQYQEQILAQQEQYQCQIQVWVSSCVSWFSPVPQTH